MNEYLPEKGYRRIFVLAVYLLLAAAAGYFVLRYLLGALLPFLLAWASAALLRPVTLGIRKKTRMTERAAGFAALFLFLTLLSLAVGLLLFAVLGQAGDLLSALLENADNLGKELISALESLLDAIPTPDNTDPAGWRQTLRDSLKQALTSLLSSLTAALPSVIASTARSLPSIFLFFTVYLISTFSLCTSYDKTMARLRSFLPDAIKSPLQKLKNQLKRFGFSYLRAALLLMLFTFVLLFLGFRLLGIPYALLLASLIAFIDLLPILGTGTVLIPWSIFCFLSHRFSSGIGLLLLFFVITVGKQILEPKIVGKSIGLSPLLTLTATYAGWHHFGYVGLILFPIASAVLLRLLPEREKIDNRKHL